MKKLYIDFDGVILDTIKTTYELMDDAQINKFDVQEARQFYRHVDWGDVLKNSPEINDAISCIQSLIDSKKYEVSILSHVVSYEECMAKIKFVKQKMKCVPIILVPREFSKTDVVNATAAILVDDYTKNLEEWAAKGGIGIKFDSVERQHQFRVITKLDQLLD